MFFDRWWQTISMSRCSSSVLRVKGRVGFVDCGSTFACSTTEMMSGAWPPPAPSVWYVWMVRPLKALIVCSTKPDSFSVSVWIRHCTSYSSQTDRHLSIAAGVEPQSSCSFRPDAPASHDLAQSNGSAVVAFSCNAMLIGRLSHACSICLMYHFPGVQVVAFVPVVGTSTTTQMVVIPASSASSAC